MAKRVRKAVIPAAGLGTRLLPLTKSVPKELLPVGRYPMIHWSVAEAAASGIEEVILVVRKGKEAIRSYFLEEGPGVSPEPPDLAGVRRLRELLRFTFVSQELPRGPGDAILKSADAIAGEPFALLYPDDIFPDTPPAMGQLIRRFEETGSIVTGLIRVREDEGGRFGNCGRVELDHIEGPAYRVRKLYDKGKGSFCVGPGGEMRWTGRHVLLPSFLEYLEAARTGTRELDDVGAFQRLVCEEGMGGLLIEGAVFDVGNMEGYLTALVHLAGREGPAYFTSVDM